MQSMNGWEKAKKTKRIEDYGIQTCRVRKDVDIEEIDTDNDEVLPWFCKQRYVSIKYLNVTKYLKYGRLVTLFVTAENVLFIRFFKTFYLYNASKGTYAYKASVKGTSYTVKKLKAGTKYTYAVKAYKDIKKSRYTSNSLTTLTTSTAPSKPTLQVSVGKAKATLSWKKGTCSGYEIYMKSGNGSYKKIATLKGSSKVSYTKSKLTTGKTYSFKVRAFTTVNGKNVYGDYSAVKSVKIK